MPTRFKSIISQSIIEIENPPVFKWIDVFSCIKQQIKESILKINLVKTTKDQLFFHVVSLEGFKSFIEDPFMPDVVGAGFTPALTNDISCLIIPTGVGALYGGYAGDANPIAKLLAEESRYLLTHPNVVNGAVLSDLPNNIIYIEGYLLDHFLLGKVNLFPMSKNKIGVIFDKSINEERIAYEVNVLNALKAFNGCEILGYTITEKPLNIRPMVSDFRFSTGDIHNLECLIEKAITLKEEGATAIAICTQMPDLELNKEYILGKGIDPIGGIESIVSHVVSAATGLVSAHAPVLLSSEKINLSNVSPVAAAEYIAQTFLPSVISGLRYAPKIVNPQSEFSESSALSTQHLKNVLVPYNAFGSAGVLFLNEAFKNVVLVKENKTLLDVDSLHLNMKFNISEKYNDFISMSAYEKTGIDPNILKRPLLPVRKIN